MSICFKYGFPHDKMARVRRVSSSFNLCVFLLLLSDLDTSLEQVLGEKLWKELSGTGLEILSRDKVDHIHDASPGTFWLVVFSWGPNIR
jgi:hypothetical protein